MNTLTYSIAYHFDVLGNAVDGYEVNDSRPCGTVTFKANAHDRTVVRNVRLNTGWCAGTLKVNRAISDDSHIEIETVDGCPVFSLHLEAMP